MREENAKQGQSLQSRIMQHYDTLSETTRRIGDEILANPDKTIHMTISQMAETCGVSEASIVRFSKMLGYEGFNEMKIYMASEMMPPSYWMPDRVSQSDSVENLVKKVFTNEVQAIQSTLLSLDMEAFKMAVDRIYHAGRLEFFATGNSRPLAMDVHYRFLCIGVPSHIDVDIANSLLQAPMLTPRDVALGVSHSGSSKYTVAALESARNAGATTICITSYEKSPITQVADICLFSRSEETMLREVAMTSRTAQIVVLDALYVAVAFRAIERTRENMKRANKTMAGEKF